MSSSSAGSPKPGGTSYPSGVEFVRYRRSCGLESRQTAPKTPRMGRESGFPSSPGGVGGGARPGLPATQLARGPPTGGSSSPRRSRPSSRLAGPSRIMSCRAVGPDGAALGRAHGDGARGVERHAARRRCGGPETGVRGGTAPRQPPQGTARSVAPRSKLACLACLACLSCLRGVRRSRCDGRRADRSDPRRTCWATSSPVAPTPPR